MLDRNKAAKTGSVKLSICIATYNRAKFIGETLDSILGQMTPAVELIVVDGASPDNTPEIMASYVARYPELHYYRESMNSGVDGDYDKAVGYAAGEYCWLMTDDDVLIPGAIRQVLSAIERGTDLVVVNAEIRNVDLTQRLQARRLEIADDVEYSASAIEDFFTRAANYLAFIGAVVIKREFWLSRDRKSYYGSLFVHVGVIFQSPSVKSVKIIAHPLIVIRNGNAMWSPRAFEIWSFKWPGLIWSFKDFSNTAKQSVCDREPWRRGRRLIFHRALGGYSIEEFRKYLARDAKGLVRAIAYIVALFPAGLANFLLVLYYGLMRRSARVALHDVLRSPGCPAASQLLARALGLSLL